MSKNYYEILGLQPGVTQKEILNAYRKMALRYHPDKNGNAEWAKEKFQEIGNAYETLSDPAKKREYDLYGDSGNNNSYGNYSYSSYNWDSYWDKWKKENDDWWNEYYKEKDEWNKKWDRKNKERDDKWLKEYQEKAIDYLEKQLLEKGVSAAKLNSQLGVNDWKTKINEIKDWSNVNDKKWHIYDIIKLLSQEFTCAACGKTRNDLYFPWKSDGKEFCDWDCKETYNKRNSKDEKTHSPDHHENILPFKNPSEEEKKEEKEICEKCYKKFPAQEKRFGENLCGGCQKLKDNQELKDEVKKMREYLENKLGGNEKTTKNRMTRVKTTVVKNPLGELVEWARKEGVTNIRLDLNSNQLVIEFGNNKSKTLADNEMSAEQKELRNFFMQNPKKSINRSEIEELGGNTTTGQEPKNKGNDKLITGVIVAGVILMIVAIIGVAIYKSRKKDY